MLKTYGVKNCGWCGEEFTASKANQVYCTSEHTRKASNQKIIERYHEAKRLKNQKGRRCDTCSNPLSKYNPDATCNPCQLGKKELERIDFLKRLGFEYISE